MSTPSADVLHRRSGKFLTFFLGEEEYGIEIFKVSEIIGAMSVTRVPGLPAFACGVVNLRGSIIPVVQLRLKLGMSESDRAESCVIVVRVGEATMGLVVDRVSDVVSFSADSVDDVPDFGHTVPQFLLGVEKSAGRVRLLLDIDRVMSGTTLMPTRIAA